MKKNLFLLIAFLFIGISAQAQLKFGVKAGVNLSKINYSDGSNLADLYNANIDNMTGFQVGPMLELTVPALGIGFDAAVLYSQEGFRLKDLENTYKANTLEIPVNFKYKLSFLGVLGIYGTAGPYAGFKLSDNLKEQYYSKTFGAGLNFGAGVELLKHLQVGFNYKLGLTDNYSNLSLPTELSEWHDMKAKQRTWTISAAYLF